MIAERIITPLSMPDTVFELSEEQARRLASGYDADGNAVPHWTVDGFAGAAGLRSTARDLARFVQAHLSRSSAIPSSLASALSETQGAQRASSEHAGSIALGWHIGADERVRWHNGETGGSHAYIAFDPERSVGVVVLANTASRVVDELGLALIRTLQGRPTELALPPTIQLSEAELQAVIGTYSFAPGVELTIRRDGERLLAQITGQPELRLYASAPTTLYWRAVQASLTLVKATDGSGAVTEVRLHQDGVESPGKRVRSSASPSRSLLDSSRDP